MEAAPSNQKLLNDYLSLMISAIERKTLEKSEEFILNAVSCATNLLFYDAPRREGDPQSSGEIFGEDLRIRIFKAVKMYVLETSNEELQIEAVRVLSNLSRHSTLCSHFVSDVSFTDALVLILDHTLRELVFYTIGIIINITMHEGPRDKLCGGSDKREVVRKLIDVLKDANIEDMDLAKVSAKALHNLAALNAIWKTEELKKLDEILTNLGEELDSIMVRLIDNQSNEHL